MKNRNYILPVENRASRMIAEAMNLISGLKRASSESCGPNQKNIALYRILISASDLRTAVQEMETELASLAVLLRSLTQHRNAAIVYRRTIFTTTRES